MENTTKTNRVELTSAATAPCKNCQSRHSGCHGHCKDYAEYRELLDQIKKKRSDEYNMSYRIICGGKKISF